MNSDKQEFEAWYDLPADQTLNDPKLYRQYLDDTLPDHTKTFCEKAFMAGIEAERARSKCLTRAYIETCVEEYLTHTDTSDIVENADYHARIIGAILLPGARE